MPRFKPVSGPEREMTSQEYADFVASQPGAMTLAERKVSAKSYIDQQTGGARLAFITDIPGQEMTYQAKEAEAKAYDADTDDPKDMSNYPYIAGEAAALSVTADTVATTYMTLSTAWRTAGVAFEALRIQSKELVDAAADNAAVDAVVASFDTSLSALVTP